LHTPKNTMKLEGVHAGAYLHAVNFYKSVVQTHFVNFLVEIIH